MVLKIVGDIERVRDLDHNRVEIGFIGSAAGTTIKERCTLVIENLIEHIIQTRIDLAGPDETPNKYIIFFRVYDHLIISDNILADIVPDLIPKRKGSGKQTYDEKAKKAIESLKGKDMFVSMNPTSNGPLSDKNLKGTHIEIVIHW